MDCAPRIPSRSGRKYVYFNPEVRINVVKPLHKNAKRSDLWVSSEDLKRTRAEFHGILDCLTLDSSLYHEGGYFLLGLDSREDQKIKYRNMLDSRYAVLKEQRHHCADSRWDCGVSSSSIETCISRSYQAYTSDAAYTARYTAMRLEEELNAKEEEKEQPVIMSLEQVKTLLQRSNSSSRVLLPDSLHDDIDEYISNNRSFAESDWSVDFSTDDEDLYDDETIEVPIREACITSHLNKRLELPGENPVEETRSTTPSSDWSVDISTDHEDHFLVSADSAASKVSNFGPLSKQTRPSSPQGSEICVPTIIQTVSPPHKVSKNAIAA